MRPAILADILSRGVLAPTLTFAVLLSVFAFTFAVDDPVSAAESLPAANLDAAVVPVAVTGEVLGPVPGGIAIQEPQGLGPVAFPAAAGLEVTRDGVSVPLTELRAGDTVRMTVDGRTGALLRADAEAPRPPVAPSGEAALLASVGLIGAGALLVSRRRQGPLGPADRGARRLPLAIPPALGDLAHGRLPRPAHWHGHGA